MKLIDKTKQERVKHIDQGSERRRLLFLKKKEAKRLFSVFRTRRRPWIADETMKVLWFLLSRRNDFSSSLTALGLAEGS